MEQILQVESVSHHDVVVFKQDKGVERHRLPWGLLEAAASPVGNTTTPETQAVYKALLKNAHRLYWQQRENRARKAFESCPDHLAAYEEDPRCFTGSITGAEENRAAHGCVRITEVCRCGARRDRNVNGGHVEQGPWYVPEM